MRILTAFLASLLMLTAPGAQAEPLSKQQQAMYWRSLSRMMESGRIDKEIHYRSQSMTVSFMAGQVFEPKPGMLCRPFNQRITRQKTSPYQQGYACRISGGWCHQMAGSEEWQCPPKTPSIVAKTFRDARIDWRNFESGIGNSYNSKVKRRLPF